MANSIKSKYFIVVIVVLSLIATIFLHRNHDFKNTSPEFLSVKSTYQARPEDTFVKQNDTFLKTTYSDKIDFQAEEEQNLVSNTKINIAKKQITKSDDSIQYESVKLIVGDFEMKFDQLPQNNIYKDQLDLEIQKALLQRLNELNPKDLSLRRVHYVQVRIFLNEENNVSHVKLLKSNAQFLEKTIEQIFLTINGWQLVDINQEAVGTFRVMLH